MAAGAIMQAVKRKGSALQNAELRGLARGQALFFFLRHSWGLSKLPTSGFVYCLGILSLSLSLLPRVTSAVQLGARHGSGLGHTGECLWHVCVWVYLAVLSGWVYPQTVVRFDSFWGGLHWKKCVRNIFFILKMTFYFRAFMKTKMAKTTCSPNTFWHN